jgi:hypothetical protein
LLSDNFDDPDAGWLPRSSREPTRYTYGYDRGEYSIRKIDLAAGGPVALLPGTYRDVALAVDARLVGETEDRYFSLACRSRGDSSGYQALINVDRGLFVVQRRDTSAQVRLVNPSPSSAIRRGTATNRAELSCVGDTISLTINGTSVTSVRDGTYQEGALGIGTGILSRTGAHETRFDNLVVTQR